MYEVDMDQINWKEAPDDATHRLIGAHGGIYWWIKINDEGGYHHQSSRKGGWKLDRRNFLAIYGNHNWVITPRPQIQPKQQGEHKMFTAKQLKDTYPHKQMRMYIEATVADAAKRPAALGQLVKKFMANCEKQFRGLAVPGDVDAAFIWANTREGHRFWSIIHGYKPKKAAKAKPFVMDIEAGGFAKFADPAVAPAEPKKEAKAAPKPAPKQVGWW